MERNQGKAEAWLVNRYKNVSKLLSEWTKNASNVAWAVGAGVLLIGYPLAISILDDRYIYSKGIRPSD